MKIRFVYFASLFLTACLPESFIMAQYGGGTGSSSDPFRIRTAEQMNAIGAHPADWNKHFILMADLDLSAYTGKQYNIVGQFPTPFGGSFDGKGHVLSELSIDNEEGNYIGLFGYADPNASIQNLGLTQVHIRGGYGIGGLVGVNLGGTIMRCFSIGNIHGTTRVGGLVGYNSGSITLCHSSMSVMGGNPVGGLVGDNEGGMIEYCFSTGYSTSEANAGGLVGTNTEGMISNCYSTGYITGKDSVGGLVGYNNKGICYQCYSKVTVEDGNFSGGLVGSEFGAGFGWIGECYSTGPVSGSVKGGLVGQGDSFDVWNSYWDYEQSGIRISAGGEKRMTAQMKTRGGYTSWEFVGEQDGEGDGSWRMCIDGVDYPRLAWEFSREGDLVCPDETDLADLLYLADPAQWLNSQTGWFIAADITFDGKVDLADFAVLAEHWMRP
jgi:hypothetical protein